MVLSAFKRRMRRTRRRFQNWATVVGLTLAGHVLEKGKGLRHAQDPVFLIYGFGATQRSLAILEERFRQDGVAFFSMNLGGFLGTFNTMSIETLADRIDEKIEAMYKKFRFRGKLTIVGHSKGGLIGHYYIKMRGGQRRVKKLITLGTPHNGTPWAMMAAMTPVRFFMKSVIQMSPSSDFIQTLKARPFPEGVAVYSIFSRDDLVCPFPLSALPETDKVKNIEVPNITHSELLIKKNIFYAIKHALQDVVPESWQRVTRKTVTQHLLKK